MVAGVVAAGAAGCGSDAETGDSTPAVLESVPPAEDDDAATADGSEDGESSEPGPATDSVGDSEDVDPTPVPASSDGPALNWPVPEPPEEIYEPTEEGAEALIQHWFDARHYARITGDTGPWREVTHDDCEVCRGHFERVDAAYPDAWFVEKEPDEVFNSYVRIESEGSASGLFAHRSVPFKAFREGELDSEYDGGSDSGFGFASLYQDGVWQVADLSYLGEYDETAHQDPETADD